MGNFLFVAKSFAFNEPWRASNEVREQTGGA